MRKFLLTLAALWFCSTLSIGEVNAADKIVLKAGHVSSLIYPHHIGLLKLQEEVRARSGGRIDVEIFPLSQLGNERDLTEGVQLGTVDLIVVGNPIISNFVPEAKVLDLPYLFKDQAHALRAIESPAGQKIVAKIEEKVGKVLGYYGNGTRSVFNKRRPINTPADLDGLKIRVTQAPVFVETFNTLGALATPLAFGEVYGALQQGVIDGAENDPSSLLGMKHYEHVEYFSLTKHFVTSGYLIMSNSRWNALSPDDQKMMLEAGKISQDAERTYEREKYEESLAELRKLGIKINEVDMVPFAEMTKPVWAKLAGDHMDLLNEIQKVQ